MCVKQVILFMLLGIINTVFTSIFPLKAELCWPSWGMPRKTWGGDWPLLPLSGGQLTLEG